MGVRNIISVPSLAAATKATKDPFHLADDEDFIHCMKWTQELRDFRHHRQGKKTQTREDEQSEKPVGTSTLQVAMSIAMPSPRRHSEGLEYCIGLVDVPWQRLDHMMCIIITTLLMISVLRIVSYWTINKAEHRTASE
jgi:hypothetical protein